jgi:sodium/hydrogen exchanger 8
MCLEFLGVSIGSVIIGVLTGLLCSYICRHTRLCDYPKYEISILLLFAYGSYALGEAIELSGIMALFFCGIVLAHYNSYNLSKTSQVCAPHKPEEAQTDKTRAQDRASRAGQASTKWIDWFPIV